METGNKIVLSTEFKTARRKFTQSVLKWSADDHVVEQKPANPPDVGDLVNILRSVGFKLRQFEKCENVESKSASTASLNNTKCKVELTCGQSGLRAILESVVGECRCPSLESAKQAEFWHVSGSAPVQKGSQESLSSTQEAGSSLVPPLSVAARDVVKDIMSRILKFMSDPKLTEVDTPSCSIRGSGQREMSRHCSLDTLSTPEQASRSCSTELLDATEKDKKSFSRTLSNIELPTCTLSPVTGINSSGEPLKRQASWSSTTVPSHLTSPISTISKSLEEVSVTEKNSIYCRLEVAKRSIMEAMSMLDVQPLTIDHAKKKLGLLEHTSTPSNRTRRYGVANSPTQRLTNKNNDIPTSAKKVLNIQASARKQSMASGVKRATPTSAKRTPGIPVPTRSLVRTQSSTITMTPVGIANTKVKKHTATPGCKTDEKGTLKSDISTGSSSSASSSSSKVRMFKNVVRRVSRLSSGGDSPRSSSNQNK